MRADVRARVGGGGGGISAFMSELEKPRVSFLGRWPSSIKESTRHEARKLGEQGSNLHRPVKAAATDRRPAWFCRALGYLHLAPLRLRSRRVARPRIGQGIHPLTCPLFPALDASRL